MEKGKNTINPNPNEAGTVARGVYPPPRIKYGAGGGRPTRDRRYIFVTTQVIGQSYQEFNQNQFSRKGAKSAKVGGRVEFKGVGFYAESTPSM